MRPNKLWMYEGMFSVIGRGFDAAASTRQHEADLEEKH